jgi:hypothetical protein
MVFVCFVMNPRHITTSAGTISYQRSHDEAYEWLNEKYREWMERNPNLDHENATSDNDRYWERWHDYLESLPHTKLFIPRKILPIK